MIAILDFGVGNVISIHKMLKYLGIQSAITHDINEIDHASHIILPGIGSFDVCMSKLKSAEFYPQLNRWILDEKKWILGICAGMQMLLEGSDEGEMPGLGWISGRVHRFDFNNKEVKPRVPHMGWNYVHPSKSDILLQGLEKPKFYFTHSYYCLPSDPDQASSFTDYGFRFVSSVHKGNIFGVQFHPEKSHKYGMKLFENFHNLIQHA